MKKSLHIRLGNWFLFLSNKDFLMYKNDLHLTFGRRELLLMWNPTKQKNPLEQEQHYLYVKYIHWSTNRCFFRVWKEKKLFKVSRDFKWYVLNVIYF